MCVNEIKKINLILRTLKVCSCSRTCKDNLVIYLERSINSLVELNEEEIETRKTKINRMLEELEL